MTRLIIHNPHANQCGKMVYNKIFGFPQHQKYTYLWLEARKQGRKVAFFVDGRQSSFYQNSLFQKTIARIPLLLTLFSLVEFWCWMVLNRISPFAYGVVLSTRSLKPERDVVFCWGYTSLRSKLDRYTGVVLVHLSHYHLDGEEIGRFVGSLQHPEVVAENDVTNHPYFRKFFPGMHRVYLLPFTYFPGRFKNVTPFRERRKECFASGSSSVPTARSFVSFYGEGAPLNPMRDSIFRKKEELAGTIDAFIFPHNDAVASFKQPQPTDSTWRSFAKRHFPSWLLKMLFKYQLPYFSFDIVKKYNEYMFFMSPEERTGLPSMKLLEGMLCGSVLVGIDDPMYTAIGFKDGVNFLSYRDGNLDDLFRKLKTYQSRTKELERIAQAGTALAQERFAPAQVFSTFWGDLERLTASINKGSWEFSSSFVQRA